jgi:hypothetical protein
MKSRLVRIAVGTGAVLAVLSCTVADRFLGRGLTVSQAQATATEAMAAADATALAPTEEGPRRLELTATPTAPRVPEDDPRSILDLEHPDHVDYFDNPDAWFDYDTSGRAAYWVADGKLFGVDYEPDEIYTWWTNTDTASGNVYAEVSATNGDCTGRDSLGIVIRVDRDASAGGYSLEVSCDGAYRFRLHQIGGDQVEFIEWTESDAVHTGPGATNRLGLWGYQARFRLYVNGQEVAQYWDTEYHHSYGTFTLYTRASQTYDLTGTFDDFAYWNIEFIP